MVGGHATNRLFLFMMLVAFTAAYLDDEMEVQAPGFHVGMIQHEDATNQIVTRLTLTIPKNTIPILYISRENWSTTHPLTDKIQNHPCNIGEFKNNICCMNAIFETYQVSPSLLGLYENYHVCPRNNNDIWFQNYTVVSTLNYDLLRQTTSENIRNANFLSSGIKTGTTLKVSSVIGNTYSNELHLKHDYVRS